MSAEDRHFYGVLTLVFGPLFILGGWLAAFTDIGVVLIGVGAVMLIAAPVLLRSFRVVPLVIALVVLGLGWPYLFFAL